MKKLAFQSGIKFAEQNTSFKYGLPYLGGVRECVDEGDQLVDGCTTTVLQPIEYHCYTLTKPLFIK